MQQITDGIRREFRGDGTGVRPGPLHLSCQTCRVTIVTIRSQRRCKRFIIILWLEIPQSRVPQLQLLNAEPISKTEYLYGKETLALLDQLQNYREIQDNGQIRYPLGIKTVNVFQLQPDPRDQGLSPWSPLWDLPPDLRYRQVQSALHPAPASLIIFWPAPGYPVDKVMTCRRDGDADYVQGSI